MSMGVKIQLPSGLQKMAGNRRVVEVEADTVREAVRALDALYPGLGNEFYDERGKCRLIYMILVNHRNAYGPGMSGGNTPLSKDDDVRIVYAALGG